MTLIPGTQGEQASTGGDAALSDTVDSALREALLDSAPLLVADPRELLSAGERVADRFTVLGFVQRGGMGAIYRGVDSINGEPVAIKILGCFGSGVRERFLREAQILSELTHPGVVKHVAHGTTGDGTLYIVMEWLQGENLAERLERAGPFEPGKAVGMLRRICEALAVAHGRGVAHRDLKPANLFLPQADPSAVKLLDFGIARSFGAPSGTLTRQGTLLGTVGYMAPEQALGECNIDARADVFALGCVLYECLTGRVPFESPHPVAVLAKVLHEDPPRPSELVPGVDARLDALVYRLLAKRREERLADAAAVLRELDAFDEAQDSVVRPKRLSSSPSASEQRLASVILGRGAAEAGEPRPPRDDSLEHLASRFGAQLARLEGGLVLLVLTGRGEANDRASQAALCALELRNQRADLTLVVATGLAETAGQLPVGAAIDRAASLLHAVPADGSVYLDETTVGLVGLRFEVKRSGGFNILLTARSDLDAPQLLMGRTTPYVGRERELRVLDGVLDECVSESVARMVLITGPPGIGKSRLAREWLARGGRRGEVRTLFARAEPSMTGSPLSLVRQLLRDAAGFKGNEEEAQLRALTEHLQRTLVAQGAQVHAEFLAEFLGVGSSLEPSALLRAARSSREIMSEQIRRALHAWLEGETAEQPLVMVLEDLHCADSSSVPFLLEALRDSSGRALMMLGLARPEAAAYFSNSSSGLCLQLRLLGLVPRAARQLVQSMLGGSIESEIVERIIRTADGNAFYLEELIRRVAAGGTEWPDTVMAMAQSRIEQLDSRERCVLRAASVLGDHCWDLAIREMVEELDVKHVLARLSEKEVLLRVPESRYRKAEEYRFRHALLRDAAYAMMTEGDRRAAHALAGEWLEGHRETNARALAEHYEAAGAIERARHWLVHASKAAVDSGDIHGTIELADRGLRLGSSGAERGCLLLLRSYAQALRGAPDLVLTREAVERLPIGSAPWWLGMAVLIFGSCICGRAAEAAPYVAIATDAPFSKDRDVPIGQGLLTLVGALVLLGKGDIAERIVERAAAVAASAEDDLVFTAFLESARAALASVAPVRGSWRLEEAFHEGRRCAALLGAVGATHGQMVTLYYVSVAAMHLGRHEDARAACQQSIDLRNSAGINDRWPELFLAKACLRLGQLEEALEAVAQLRNSEDCMVRQMLPVIAAEARLRQGRFEAAERDARPAHEGSSPRLSRLAACVIARAQLGLGRYHDALETAQGALRLPTSSGLESDIDLHTLRAESLAALGYRSDAAEAAATAWTLVESIARDISDPSMKRTFLERVEPCARAAALQRRFATAGIS